MRLHEREIHGGTVNAGKSDKPVILFERDDTILVQKGYQDFVLSAASARIMARKLNRLALRLEKRAASAIEAASAGETPSGSTEGENAVPQADAQ